ncbi:AAA family ATPase [Azospirillum argentinense]|uniref:AAA family ATPase n=1 Tax=Azospirillum argentinense TaxID=2970906 RepID=A0ABW8VCZ4_9PROT
MTDWRSLDWWSLAGPTRFLDRAVAALLGAEARVVGLSLPGRRPDGLLDALACHVEGATASATLRIDASSGLRGRSPTTVMAMSVGEGITGVRSVAELLDAPRLAGRVILLDGIPQEEWFSWAYVLRQMRSERVRRARMMPPSLAVVFPPGISPHDARAAVDTDLRWSGQVSRLDTQMFVEAVLGWPDDSLASRAAVSVVTEMVGWDPSMARSLAGLAIEKQIDPRATMAALPDVLGGQRPCWENGMVDRWDGAPWVHTAALASAKLHESISLRAWRGQVRAVFPFLDQVRNAFASKYEARLRSHMPYTKNYNGRTDTYHDPWKLELYDLNALVKADLPAKEAALLDACIRVRRCMAHYEPAAGGIIRMVSDLWEEIGHGFPDGCAAWEWPRCGQKLVIMVGPTCAGKSRWARRRYAEEEIVEADAIRKSLNGSLDMAGDQSPVFERVRREVLARLSVGRTVVVDSTNLKREDRLANALLAPSDIPVEYVVVDRPLEEKVGMAGWRADKPGLIELHAKLFESGLPDILGGDGLPNVRVLDHRVNKGAPPLRAASGPPQ